MNTSLKRYTHTSPVIARGMKRGDYWRYRGWPFSKGADPDDVGFMIISGIDTESPSESWLTEADFNKEYSEV